MDPPVGHKIDRSDGGGVLSCKFCKKIYSLFHLSQ